MAWVNNDGLHVRFGTEQGAVTLAGEYPTPVAGMHITEARLNAVSLALAPTIVANTTVIPSGATIHKVEVIAETACTSGGAAVVNIGLHRLDRTTVINATGLVAALALASINVAGETNTLIQGATSAGALIGTELVNPGLLVADYDTAAFTAGEILVKVYWYID